MTENPQPDPLKPPTEMEVIKLGFLQVPKDQLFPVLLVFVLLVSGVGVVIAARETIQLLGLITIIVGLGWAAFIYQNAQNRLKYGAQEVSKKFNITILVLSLDSQPVRGASVTVLGPVAFTDRKTDKDGRVIYSYTGGDANNYRNREVIFSAKQGEAAASVSEKLLLQDGHYIELRLKRVSGAGSSAASAAPLIQNIPAIDSGALPSMSINADLFQRIVAFVIPHVSNVGSRSALVNRAFFSDPIVGLVNTSGNAANFANHLITQLYAKGGEAMVIQLLSELRRDLGASKQMEIDALITELQAQ